MALLVLAFPKISQENYDFIQNFRKVNDRHYPLFEPHFTLVFPAYGISEDEFIKHVTDKAKGFKKIDFSLNCAITIKDSFSEFRDVMLVVDKGNGAIIKMHDSLYKGILITHLRIDIPYIPHMTIGNDEDQFHCINLANELNGREIAIPGTIYRLSIVRYGEDKAEIIQEIDLD